MTATSRSEDRRPTVRDVATVAGVSVATVSRVLSGSSKRVEESTRTRVVEAAASLGYAVNVAAQSLATGRNGNVAVIVPDLGNQHFTMIAQSIIHESRAAGFHIFVGDSVGSRTQEAALTAEMSLRSDGLILCSPRASFEALEPVFSSGKPIVAVNRRFVEAPAASSVIVDVLAATREIIQTMLELGHRSFAYVGANSGSRQNQRRWILIKQLVDSAGGTVVNETFDDGHPDLLSEVKRLLALGATALVAANDVTAAALISTLTSMGVAVPRDVSVSGWDDTPLARWITPQLTTAVMHEDEVGREAWHAMADLLASPSTVSHIELTSTPVFRESIGPAPA